MSLKTNPTRIYEVKFHIIVSEYIDTLLYTYYLYEEISMKRVNVLENRYKECNKSAELPC